jgi:hypothetical protein
MPALAPPAADIPAAEGVVRLGPADGYRIMIQALSRPGASPRFPMYARQFKHFMKTFDESFDERRYGFAGILDALRFGQREGLFRLDRDRQGGVRVHPGPQYQQLTQSPEAPPAASASLQEGTLPVAAEVVAVQDALVAPDQPPTAPERPPVAADATSEPRDADEASLESSGEVSSTDATDSPAGPAPATRRTSRKRPASRTSTRAKKAAAPAVGAKKTAARPRAKKS